MSPEEDEEVSRILLFQGNLMRVVPNRRASLPGDFERPEPREALHTHLLLHFAAGCKDKVRFFFKRGVCGGGLAVLAKLFRRHSMPPKDPPLGALISGRHWNTSSTRRSESVGPDA